MARCFLIGTCYYSQRTVFFRSCCTSRNFFYFNLGDDIGEDHTLGELFLSWKSPGETYPALLELCHTNDFKAISLWIGVPILREILNLWMRSDILKVECAVSVNSALVYLMVFPVHWK